MSSVNEIKEFYSNDIVYRFDKRKRINFGVVVDSYEGSPSDSDDVGSLKKGQIRVSWVNGYKESVWKQSKVRLMCRSIISGDIVRRLEKGKETQRGYCKDTKQYAAVQIVGTDRIVERVTGDRLTHLFNYDLNVPVCLGTNYGRIQSIDEKVTMKSKCGSIVEFYSSLNHAVEDYWVTKCNRGYFDNYYPGQELVCVPSDLEQPNWINRSKYLKRNMMMQQRFTVQKVETTDMEVAWYESMSNVSVNGIFADEIKELKIARPVEHNHLDLSERRLLKLSATDTIIKKNDWIRKLSSLHQPEHKVVHVVKKNTLKNRGLKVRRSSLLTTCGNTAESEEGWSTEEGEDDNASSSSSSNVSQNRQMRHFPPKLSELIPGRSIPVEVLCMDSKVTIVWQDGTEEKDIPTTQLYYSISPDEHEFFPGEWVVRDNIQHAGFKHNKEFGVIQFVDHLERTTTVKWFKNSNDNQKPVFLMTEEVSVYDLRKHSKFGFRPGSIVKRIPLQENKFGSVLDSCPEGYVIVNWIDGTQENCWPMNLELIPESIEYDYSLEDNDSIQTSWETESLESFIGDVQDENVLQNMATRLDFVRARLGHLKEVLRHRSNQDSFCLVKELLTMYDNSSYLDKLLETSFFSLKSRHFLALISQIKEKAQSLGVELRGRLFSTVDNLGSTILKSKCPEKENINKILKMEQKMNLDLEIPKNNIKDSKDCTTPTSPEVEIATPPHENICVELISMMKARMDLAYAEIISRIGGPQALTVMTTATGSTSAMATPMPSIPTTPEESQSSSCPLKLVKSSVMDCESDVYGLIDEVHTSHHYYSSKFEPKDKNKFIKAVQKEFTLLKEALPPGVWVRCYANRMDLLSVMIRGPAKTPYEDGLFLFDLLLSKDYPESPPFCYYVSYSQERLNPNLYVEGKVCISLLGTWIGRGNEVWNSNSTLLQLIVSIQGLILVAEPYYNEAGYEKQVSSQQGYENSRTYNELVILKLVQSMTEMLRRPSEVFKHEVLTHFSKSGESMCERLQKWCDDSDPVKPNFPLLPVSKGLKLSLFSALNTFKEVLKNVTEK